MPPYTVHTKVAAAERQTYKCHAESPEKAAEMADEDRKSGERYHTVAEVSSEDIIEQVVVEDESGDRTLIRGGVHPADPAIADILGVLNEAVAADRYAMTNLMDSRVACNDALAGHPTIQVQGGIPDAPDPIPDMLGPIGLMCGFIERMKEGFRLVAHFDDAGIIKKFTVVEWAKRKTKEEG